MKNRTLSLAKTPGIGYNIGIKKCGRICRPESRCGISRPCEKKEGFTMYADLLDSIGLINKTDPEVASAMQKELSRQRRNIELIASENIVSPAVMAAMGSILTNKYAEGYPGNGTTAAVNTSISSRISRETVPASCSAPNMQTFSPIPAHRPTSPFILHCSNPAIPSSHEPGRGRPSDPRLQGQHLR